MVFWIETIKVKFAEFDPEEVKQAAHNALQTAFDLENRQFDKPLYRSELYKVVETVKGVENSSCVLSFTQQQGLDKPMIDRPRAVNWESVGDKQVVRYIQPRDWQVVYAAKEHSSINITAEEYEL